MNKTLLYLLYFCVYSVILLIIGKSSFREGSTVKKFFVGGRSMGLLSCVLTFSGTWISAATVLGFTGSVFESGYAALLYSVVPWFIGAFLLAGISGRLYENDILTVPEFFYKRFNSKGLQVLYGIILCFSYIYYLVIQIRGFGLVASTLFEIPYTISIFLIYLFILYSTFGGFYTVSKTDAFNLTALTLGLVIVFCVVVSSVGGIGSINRMASEVNGYAYLNISYYTERGDLLKFFGKGKFAPLMSMTMFSGWGLGLAANPQYIVRILSAKDKKTAFRTVIYSLVFLAIIYFALLQIGLGMRVMFPFVPEISNTDEIFVYMINNCFYSKWSGFFLFTMIGACISTANSQLLLISSSFTYDIVKNIRKKEMKESSMLCLSRITIFVGGTLSLLLAVNPPESLISFGGDIWGIFGCTLFPTLYGSLLYKKTNLKGVWAATISGIIVMTLLYYPYIEEILPIHPSFPAMIVSSFMLIIVSKFSKSGEKHDEI